MKVPINDLRSRAQAARSDLTAALERVLDSGWFVLGPEVMAFEAEFARYLAVGHCVSVANGSDALELALKALGVVCGTRVATVANASMYTTGALLAIGAEPVFMDVQLDSCNVGLAQVQAAVQQGAQVVVVTHLYGVAVADIAEIAAWCAAQGVALLEDCAQAHGARVQGRCVGGFGDAAAFSFYPTKNLGALGDGGAVVTQRAEIAERVLQLRQYGWSRKYEVALQGGRNSRLDEMQAAVLRVFLPRLDTQNAQRRAIAERYAEGIRHAELSLPRHPGDSSVVHLYVVRSAQRDALRAHLLQSGVGAEVHYPIPDHHQPVLSAGLAGLRLPHTEQLAREILTLPCHPGMDAAQVQHVIAAVNAWTP
jgi:aminotransferase EvaB